MWKATDSAYTTAGETELKQVYKNQNKIARRFHQDIIISPLKKNANSYYLKDFLQAFAHHRFFNGRDTRLIQQRWAAIQTNLTSKNMMKRMLDSERIGDIEAPHPFIIKRATGRHGNLAYGLSLSVQDSTSLVNKDYRKTQDTIAIVNASRDINREVNLKKANYQAITVLRQGMGIDHADDFVIIWLNLKTAQEELIKADPQNHYPLINQHRLPWNFSPTIFNLQLNSGFHKVNLVLPKENEK